MRVPRTLPARSRGALLWVAALLFSGVLAVAVVVALVSPRDSDETQDTAESPPDSAEGSPTSCVADPGGCGFPDASSTGHDSSTVLKEVPGDVRSGPGWHYDSRGWVEIDGEGATFSGYRVRTNVNVSASNVTIRNNWITTKDSWNISLRRAHGVTIDRNTLDGPSRTETCDNAIRDIHGDSDDVTITANNIYFCFSGINHFNQGGLIEGNFIHDLGVPCPGDDPDCGHWNGIQLGAGAGPLMTINRNTIFLPLAYTDAIMLANDDGPQTNRRITDNLLAGGGYTFYGSGGPDGQATNIVFTGNQFATGYFPRGGAHGPVAHWQFAEGNVWADNTWADGPEAGERVEP